ncbi:unnamed protein product [Adineta ricciae]|uniref:Uncharacterized protein n=1 Tax=Adineta ricciae TaxID=249248 RepID=A0A815R7I6_ADIRI|nr:unnamed protein product [Adineta ricciae]CAF1646989.1 unnamed protein product [Adineta ricciae]
MQGRHEAFICPRCPDSERHENYPAMMKTTNRLYQPQVLQASRKHLARFSLFSHYDCRTIISRISESIWNITDLNERQRVKQVLRKNWFLFTEPVEITKVEKLLHRQRSQYEYRLRQERIHLESFHFEQTDLVDTHSVHTFMPDESTTSNLAWSDGTESWHIHEITPQRESFARTSCVEVMNSSSQEANLSLSRSEPQFESHINDLSFRHAPETASQRLLFVHASCSAKLSNELTTVYFIEHQQPHCSIQPEPHVSRQDFIMYGYQHLLFLLKSTWAPLLWLIWLFDTPKECFGNFSILNLTKSKTYSYVSIWSFHVNTFLIHYSTFMINFNPFVKTIVTLRTLESLLLYATTC